MKKYAAGQEREIRLSTFIYAILIIGVLFIGACSILAYGTRTVIGGKIAGIISKAIPFPAAIINYTNFVYLGDVEKNLASIEKFYQTQDLSKEGLRVDFTTPDGQKRLEIKRREIIDKLVENKIIEILAKSHGISISKVDMDKAVTQQLEQYGTTDEVKNNLLSSYGWSLDDFKQQVVLPGMYQSALAVWVAQQQTDSAKPKGRIMEAQKQLQAGKDFVQVVRDYSEGSSKGNGGELGWVMKDQVAPELQDALFGQKSYEKNTVIESSIGFHIVDIENRKKEKGEDVLQIRQIFVSKNTFADWLQDQKMQMFVLVPPSGFEWDKSKGSIDFSNPQMRSFEADQRFKAQGDASITF